MSMDFIFDIRTSDKALETLVGFTNITPEVWIKNLPLKSTFQYDDDWVEDIINRYGHFPIEYEKWRFVYFHITTSANSCSSFKKHGILDLQHSYLCADSELRIFLENNGIEINLHAKTLKHNGKVFDISYGKCPSELDSKAYYCWCIGRKFYYDYTTCGFLSVWTKSPYGGYVHRRPEILFDIDNLLNLNLSQEWHLSHSPYEIVAMVNGTNIVYDGYDEQTDKDKTLSYLTEAFNTAFGEPTEKIVLLKNGIQVTPQNIIEINPLTYW